MCKRVSLFIYLSDAVYMCPSAATKHPDRQKDMRSSLCRLVLTLCRLSVTRGISGSTKTLLVSARWCAQSLCSYICMWQRLATLTQSMSADSKNVIVFYRACIGKCNTWTKYEHWLSKTQYCFIVLALESATLTQSMSTDSQKHNTFV